MASVPTLHLPGLLSSLAEAHAGSNATSGPLVTRGHAHAASAAPETSVCPAVEWWEEWVWGVLRPVSEGSGVWKSWE